MDKTTPPVIGTADDPRTNSTVGAGGDSSAFVVAPVEGIEEDSFLSVMLGVVAPVPSVLATWKLALMTRS